MDDFPVSSWKQVCPSSKGYFKKLSFPLKLVIFAGLVSDNIRAWSLYKSWTSCYGVTRQNRGDVFSHPVLGTKKMNQAIQLFQYYCCPLTHDVNIAFCFSKMLLGLSFLLNSYLRLVFNSSPFYITNTKPPFCTTQSTAVTVIISFKTLLIQTLTSS